MIANRHKKPTRITMKAAVTAPAITGPEVPDKAAGTVRDISENMPDMRLILLYTYL